MWYVNNAQAIDGNLQIHIHEKYYIIYNCSKLLMMLEIAKYYLELNKSILWVTHQFTT